MPVVFNHAGWRFHFFSSEGEPREPIHVHVAKRGEGDAKLWLYPEVSLAYNRGLDARALRCVSEIAAERRQEITDAWHDHFGTRDQG